MKVGILGTGNLGKALAEALTKKTYHVMIGSRDPEKADELAMEMGHYAKGGTLAHAIHFGEVVILAMPYKSIEETLRNIDSFRGKVVVDATNPLVPGKMMELSLGHTTSAAEQIAKMIPEAKVVKAMNTAFSETYESPSFGPHEPSMFYCGDDDEAKAAVASIIKDLDFEPIDCGPLDSARFLEPMAALIVRLGVNMGMGREIAFNILQR